MEADEHRSEVAVAVRFSLWSWEDADPAASETFPCASGVGEEPRPFACPAPCSGMWGPLAFTVVSLAFESLAKSQIEFYSNIPSNVSSSAGPWGIWLRERDVVLKSIY